MSLDPGDVGETMHEQDRRDAWDDAHIRCECCGDECCTSGDGDDCICHGEVCADHIVIDGIVYCGAVCAEAYGQGRRVPWREEMLARKPALFDAAGVRS